MAIGNVKPFESLIDVGKKVDLYTFAPRSESKPKSKFDDYLVNAGAANGSNNTQKSKFTYPSILGENPMAKKTQK